MYKTGTVFHSIRPPLQLEVPEAKPQPKPQAKASLLNVDMGHPPPSRSPVLKVCLGPKALDPPSKGSSMFGYCDNFIHKERPSYGCFVVTRGPDILYTNTVVLHGPEWCGGKSVANAGASFACSSREFRTQTPKQPIPNAPKPALLAGLGSMKGAMDQIEGHWQDIPRHSTFRG